MDNLEFSILAAFFENKKVTQSVLLDYTDSKNLKLLYEKCESLKNKGFLEIPINQGRAYSLKKGEIVLIYPDYYRITKLGEKQLEDL